MHQEVNISGLILAGGEGRRMNFKDKGLVHWQKKPLIEEVVTRFRPQVAELLISCNQNEHRYQAFGQTIGDGEFFRLGPLAGIYSGLLNCQFEYLAVVPVDSPLLPLNLVSTLCRKQAQTSAKIVFVETPLRTQPLFCLLHKSLTDSLYDYLKSGNRQVYQWMKQQAYEIAKFDEDDPFTNINTSNQLT